MIRTALVVRGARVCCWLLVAALLVPLLQVRAVRAELSAPSANDRYVTRAVTMLLGREHLTRHQLDDEISERCLTTFLKALDPMKLYFNQSDIDAFERSRKDLDDRVRKGDVAFAYDVYKQYLARVDQRVNMVNDLLKQPHDFTVQEEMIADPDAASYAKDDAEAREMWRKRIKYELLTLKLENKTGQEAIDKLTRRYQSFARRMHQTSADELLETYLTALTTSYDPHTTYMSASSLEDFEIQMRLQLDGIGAALQSEDGYTTISKIIPGGAADKEGTLKAKDRVIGVGQGLEGEIVDVVDMKLKDVVALIRGKRDTVVRLQVIPDGGTEAKIVTITRASIELKDSEAQSAIFEEGRKANGEPYRIGVIDLPSFYMDMDGAREKKNDFKSTTRDVKKILEKFNAENVDAVVVDLRRNGGGALPEAINLTGLFVDTGPIVQVKGPVGDPQHYDDLEAGADWNGPLVVLISKFSASASEIFAGAIQDYGRGLIVGDRSTHGKGTVQSLLDLGQQLLPGQNAPNLGALKLTMQQFYRPNGDSTQNRGVVSDVELPSITTHLDVGEADLDHALAFDKVEPAQYENTHHVDPTVLDQIRNRSKQRCELSPDFVKVMENIARYQERKQRKTVSLNEQAFMADRGELDKQEEEKKTEELLNPSSQTIQRDFYMDEALRVTLDYLQLQNIAKAR
jgi:carboxyl-terminal processing protease